MAGLNIAQFLDFNKGTNRNAKFFDWKKAGTATIWICTKPDIAYASWNHPFIVNATYTDKKTDKEHAVLRWPRFVSPDSNQINAEQHFRDDDKTMSTKPKLDPFLLLREYLREDESIPLDAVVFEWFNPKKSETIQWRKGAIAKLADRTFGEWGHTLDTKLEYYFTIVDANDVAAGPQIVSTSKMLGEAMQDLIVAEMESNGVDAGNPQITPYAFRWTFSKNEPIAKMYKAHRYNAAELTEGVRAAIDSNDCPSPDSFTRVQPGDKLKIRAAMEDAAQIDLPWDRLFVDAWNDESPESIAAPKQPERARPTPEVKTTVEAPKAATVTDIKTQANRRRKKADPKPEPKVETVPCDDCNHAMLLTDAVCSSCGAEYDVPETEAVAAPANVKPEVAKCWSCSSTNIVDGKCECGTDTTDDFPFD